MSRHVFHQESLRIAGRRVVGDGRTIEVRDPWTGEVAGTVPKARVEDVREALETARRYRPTLSRADRAAILERAGALVVAREDELAALITLESGLCLKDSRYEIGRVRDVFRFAAQAALRDDGEIFSCDITPHGRRRRVYTQRDPLLGVIVAITPFNHPMNQVAHKVAPAIATNNRMLLKPSEKVPLSALRLADILYEAGLPPPMFQVVTGDPAEIAGELLTHPAVDLVTFTGGAAIGRQIAERAGYRRLVLELGGNDPLIVMDDADLDEAAARCFEQRVVEAVAAGATLRVGNLREGASYSPTVIDHVRPDMTVVVEETFGPVSPVIRFDTLDEAIAIVNGSRFGLSSGVCTNRLDVITRLVAELEVGTVNVREVPGYRLELTPFGGIKDSGLGYKEGVQEAMKSFTNLKTYSLPWPA